MGQSVRRNHMFHLDSQQVSTVRFVKMHRRRKTQITLETLQKPEYMKITLSFYKKRGTDTNGSWYGVTNGHKMVKTKFDWSGKTNTVASQAGLAPKAKNTKSIFKK